MHVVIGYLPEMLEHGKRQQQVRLLASPLFPVLSPSLVSLFFYVFCSFLHVAVGVDHWRAVPTWPLIDTPMLSGSSEAHLIPLILFFSSTALCLSAVWSIGHCVSITEHARSSSPRAFEGAEAPLHLRTYSPCVPYLPLCLPSSLPFPSLSLSTLSLSYCFSLTLSLSNCLSVCVPVCLCLCFCLSVCVSVCLSNCLLTCSLSLSLAVSYLQALGIAPKLVARTALLDRTQTLEQLLPALVKVSASNQPLASEPQPSEPQAKRSRNKGSVSARIRCASHSAGERGNSHTPYGSILQYQSPHVFVSVFVFCRCVKAFPACLAAQAVS